MWIFPPPTPTPHIPFFLTLAQQKTLIIKTIIKKDLHELIDNCEDESLLHEAKTLLEDHSSDTDWWDKMSDDDRNIVRESEAEYKKGNFITFTELMQQLDAKKKK